MIVFHIKMSSFYMALALCISFILFRNGQLTASIQLRIIISAIELGAVETF